MTISLREIALDMDPCATDANISLDRIGRLHRWGYDTFESGVSSRPEILSLRYLAHKHMKCLKFLWLNTYLLPSLKLETPVYSGQVFEGAPERSSRAYEIGTAIKNGQYDVASLCEVFTVQNKETLLSAWENAPFSARGPGEGKLTFSVKVPVASQIPVVGDLFKVDVLTIETISSGLLTILPGNYTILSSDTEAFAEKGSQVRDADAWANKGVLQVVVETGFNTKLEIYSTHLIYGGGLIGDISIEERYEIQKKQLEQLVNFILRKRNPANFIMVVGDFNIFASEELYNELRWRMEQQLGLEDVWSRYAIARYGAKLGQTEDSSSCTTEQPPWEIYADDKTSGGVSEEGRIDYIFIQKPSEKHDLSIDLSRPRRLPFNRNESASGYDQIRNLSDHAGLELKLFISSKHLPAHPNATG